MNPLATITYIVDKLSGTAYEPWVNLLLFCLLLVAVIGAFRLFVCKGTFEAIRSVGSQAKARADKHSTYAPEWERFRVRVEPYVSFLSSLFFAFCGAFSALIVGIPLARAAGRAPLNVVTLGAVWVIISFVYMRFALVAASWAYHRMKNGGSNG